MQTEGRTDRQGDLEEDLDHNEIEVEDSTEVQEEPDSVEDSVRKAIEQVSSQETDDQEPNEPEPRGEEPKAPSEPEEKEPEKLQGIEDIEAPDQFPLEGKEEFNKLPKKMKPFVKDYVQSLRKERGRFINEFNDKKAMVDQVAGQYQEFEKLISPKLSEWGAKNVTPLQGLSSLVLAHDVIIKHPVEGLRAMAQDLGVSPHDLFPELNGEASPNGQAPHDIKNDPYVKNLENQITQLSKTVKPIQNDYESQRQNQENAFYDAIAQEIISVRNEKDQSGRYLYPKLHDETFLQRANSLTVAIKDSSPEKTWAEAVKSAYLTLAGDPLSGQVRPQTNPGNISRSSATIRGSGTPKSGVSVDPASIPDKVEDSVRQAVEQLQRGGTY